jgi:hypothetical protein
MRRNRSDPIPVMVLGRLAIHKDYQQQGLGTAQLRDAMLRTVQAAAIVGMTALLVHALTEQARRFYRFRGFMESPIQPMTMYQRLATSTKRGERGNDAVTRSMMSLTNRRHDHGMRSCCSHRGAASETLLIHAVRYKGRGALSKRT